MAQKRVFNNYFKYPLEWKLTQKTLKELLQYYPNTGVFIRKKNTHHNAKEGDKAGTLTSEGYIKIRLNSRRYSAHRLAFLYMEGQLPETLVDHINGVKSDNRWGNLRKVSSLENNRNLSKRKDNSTGVTGVVYHRRDKRWVAQIGVDGVNKYLGAFKTREEAIEARKASETQLGFHKNHGRGEQQIGKEKV